MLKAWQYRPVLELSMPLADEWTYCDSGSSFCHQQLWRSEAAARWPWRRQPEKAVWTEARSCPRGQPTWCSSFVLKKHISQEEKGTKSGCFITSLPPSNEIANQSILPGWIYGSFLLVKSRNPQKSLIKRGCFGILSELLCDLL